MFFVLSKLIVPTTAYPLQEVMSSKSGSVFFESYCTFGAKTEQEREYLNLSPSPLFSLVLTLLGVGINKTRCGRTWQATSWHSSTLTIIASIFGRNIVLLSVHNVSHANDSIKLVVASKFGRRLSKNKSSTLYESSSGSLRSSKREEEVQLNLSDLPRP